MSKSVWFALGLAAALLSGASAAVAGDGSKSGGKAAKHQKARQVKHAGRADAAVFLATLQPTDEQRRLIAAKAKEAAPIVAAARQEVRRVVTQAMEAAGKDCAKPDRKAVRASAKVEIKAIRDKARTQVEPLAREVVASFTPEQRQRIQGLAGKHAKTFDDARLTKIVGRMIGRPTAATSHEAR